MSTMSLQDYGFLALESEKSPTHVASLQIFRLPEGAGPDHISNLVEELRRRKPGPPLNLKPKLNLPNLLGALLPGISGTQFSLPQWVEDHSIDMSQHVLHFALPAPGTREQLLAFVEEKHQQLLSRDRPLWQCYVIEGLDEGRRFAVYTKIHHACTDGVMYAMRVSTNFAKTADAPSKAVWETPENWSATPRKTPTLIGEWGEWMKLVLRQYLSTGEVSLSLLQESLKVMTRGSLNRLIPFRAPVTPLDRPLTADRSVATASLPMGRVKQSARAANVTVNDFLLTCCDMALRRYLKTHDVEIDRPLVAMMPMSLRQAGDTTAFNAVTMVPLELGAGSLEPVDRLRIVAGSAEAVKEERASDVTEDDIGALLLSALLAQLGHALKLEGKIPAVGNMVLSNVPGPRGPLYLLGNLLEELYPVSVIGPGLHLNFTVCSYDDRLWFGIVGLQDATPDLPDLAHYLEESFEVLEAAVHRVVEPQTEPEIAGEPKTEKKRVGTTEGKKAGSKKPAAASPKTSGKPAGTKAKRAVKRTKAAKAGAAKAKSG